MSITEFKHYHRNLTNRRLAKLFGVDPATIWRWHSGQTPMPQSVALAIDALSQLPSAQLADTITRYR